MSLNLDANKSLANNKLLLSHQIDERIAVGVVSVQILSKKILRPDIRLRAGYITINTIILITLI